MINFAKILAVGCLSWLPLSSAAEAAPFQQYKNAVCAPGSLTCSIDFAVVPAGRRLDITNTSCYLRTSAAVNVYAMQLLVTEGTATKSALTLVPIYVSSIGTPLDAAVFTTNDAIFAFANAGKRFRAYVELTQGTFSQFACHISGQMQSSS